MATARTLLHRSQTLTLTPYLRPLSTSAAPPNHQFLSPNTYLNSWAPPTTPKEAEARLAHLRRDYANKVKLVRKEYILEMEAQRAEKQRKDEAKREATRVANEERRAAKAASKKQRAVERELADHEFRQTLLKERTQKLEYWKMRVEQVDEQKKKAKEDVRKRSSLWVDEQKLEKKILEAMVDITQL